LVEVGEGDFVGFGDWLGEGEAGVELSAFRETAGVYDDRYVVAIVYADVTRPGW
jgi:hypothetical protein